MAMTLTWAPILRVLNTDTLNLFIDYIHYDFTNNIIGRNITIHKLFYVSTY